MHNDDGLQALISHSEDTSVNALCEVVTRHIEAANTIRASRTHQDDDDNSWKLCEAAVLALSIAKDEIIEKIDAGTLHFDLIAFLNSVILAILNDSSDYKFINIINYFILYYFLLMFALSLLFFLAAHPFLLGRCLCLSGRYAKKIPPEISSRFLEATVNGLQENQPICIRISSVRAVYWFCEASTTANAAIRDIVRLHLPAIFQGLFAITNQPSTEVLTLVMETFSVLVAVSNY